MFITFIPKIYYFLKIDYLIFPKNFEKLDLNSPIMLLILFLVHLKYIIVIRNHWVIESTKHNIFNIVLFEDTNKIKVKS